MLVTIDFWDLLVIGGFALFGLAYGLAAAWDWARPRLARWRRK